MHNLLIENIKEIVPITESDIFLIKQTFNPVHLKKKQFLLRAGDVSNHMRFVVGGCVKVYSISGEGNEQILQFGASGWWINDLYSYLTKKPATFFIQAITESTLLQISRSSLDQLFDQVPMMDRFFRIKTQNGYVALQERTVQVINTTAEQRYLEFIRRYRHLEQQIPQYMLASYLGVTPEHLSTIRKKIVGHKIS